jgi:molybdopterin-binding protein
VSGTAVVSARYPVDGSVVDVRDLQLTEGERVVIYGPNGAGKSTLLRLLAGALPGGFRLDAAYLPQHPYLFRGSAGWNLGLGLTAEQSVWAGQLARRFGVAKQLSEPAAVLSGGERQRLVLARTLAMRRPWLLLDEPLSALDVADRLAVAAQLAELLEGRSAVIVTHDREEAVVLGQRMAVMVGGRILQEGPVAEVFSLPAGEEVARAVGVANVLEGIAGIPTGPLVTVEMGGVRVSGIGTVPRGARARAFFGAEAVTLFAGRDAASGSAVNHWPGTVTRVREAGRLVHLTVDVGVPVVALLTPGSLEGLGFEPGSEITAAVKATAVRITPA